MNERRKRHFVVSGLLFALVTTSIALWSETGAPPPGGANEEPTDLQQQRPVEEAERRVLPEGAADSAWTSDHPEHGGEGSGGPEVRQRRSRSAPQAER